MKKRLTGLSLLVFLFAVGAHAADDTVLAEIGTRKITQADYDRAVRLYPDDAQKAFKTNQNLRQRMLTRMVQLDVLSGIAREKQIHDIPEVKDQIRMMVDDFLSKEVLKRDVVEKISITEEDAKQYYDANKESYRVPERVKVRHILVKAGEDMSDAEKQNARKRADDLVLKVNAGGDFAELASQFSEDPTSQKKGGDLGYVTRGKMVPSFEDAAFALDPGEISDVVETPFGYHIIKVEGKEAASLKPFSEVRPEIEQALVKIYSTNNVKAYVDDAMEKAGVKIYFERLSPQ